MSNTFLSNLMRAMFRATNAERALVFDDSLEKYDEIMAEDAEPFDDDQETIQEVISGAFQNGKSVITNNMITDPADAPQTNTALGQMRIVLAIPVAKQGVVYLDRPLALGVFPRDAVEKLDALVDYVLTQDKLDLSEDDLIHLYDSDVAAG